MINIRHQLVHLADKIDSKKQYAEAILSVTSFRN